MIVRRWGTAERLQFGIYGCFKICLWNRITFLLIFFGKARLGACRAALSRLMDTWPNLTIKAINVKYYYYKFD